MSCTGDPYNLLIPPLVMPDPQHSLHCYQLPQRVSGAHARRPNPVQQ